MATAKILQHQRSGGDHQSASPDPRRARYSNSSVRSVGGLSIFQDPTAGSSLPRNEELTFHMYDRVSLDAGERASVISEPYAYTYSDAHELQSLEQLDNAIESAVNGSSHDQVTDNTKTTLSNGHYEEKPGEEKHSVTVGENSTKATYKAEVSGPKVNKITAKSSTSGKFEFRALTPAGQLERLSTKTGSVEGHHTDTEGNSLNRNKTSTVDSFSGSLDRKKLFKTDSATVSTERKQASATANVSGSLERGVRKTASNASGSLEQKTQVATGSVNGSLERTKPAVNGSVPQNGDVGEHLDFNGVSNNRSVARQDSDLTSVSSLSSSVVGSSLQKKRKNGKISGENTPSNTLSKAPSNVSDSKQVVMMDVYDDSKKSAGGFVMQSAYAKDVGMLDLVPQGSGGDEQLARRGQKGSRGAASGASSFSTSKPQQRSSSRTSNNSATTWSAASKSGPFSKHDGGDSSSTMVKVERMPSDMSASSQAAGRSVSGKSETSTVVERTTSDVSSVTVSKASSRAETKPVLKSQTSKDFLDKMNAMVARNVAVSQTASSSGSPVSTLKKEARVPLSPEHVPTKTASPEYAQIKTVTSEHALTKTASPEHTQTMATSSEHFNTYPRDKEEPTTTTDELVSPLSPRQEIQAMKAKGTVGSLVKGKFKDLNLTGRSQSFQQQKSGAEGQEGEAVASPATEDKKYKFLIEGIDVPAVKAEENEEEAKPEDEKLTADEQEENRSSLKRKGFSYVKDEEQTSEILKRAAVVSSKKPHESLEIGTRLKSESEVMKEAEYLVHAKAQLKRESTMERKQKQQVFHSALMSELQRTVSKADDIQEDDAVPESVEIQKTVMQTETVLSKPSVAPETVTDTAVSIARTTVEKSGITTTQVAVERTDVGTTQTAVERTDVGRTQTALERTDAASTQAVVERTDADTTQDVEVSKTVATTHRAVSRSPSSSSEETVVDAKETVQKLDFAEKQSSQSPEPESTQVDSQDIRIEVVERKVERSENGGDNLRQQLKTESRKPYDRQISESTKNEALLLDEVPAPYVMRELSKSDQSNLERAYVRNGVDVDEKREAIVSSVNDIQGSKARGRPRSGSSTSSASSREREVHNLGHKYYEQRALNQIGVKSQDQMTFKDSKTTRGHFKTSIAISDEPQDQDTKQASPVYYSAGPVDKESFGNTFLSYSTTQKVSPTKSSERSRVSRNREYTEVEGLGAPVDNHLFYTAYKDLSRNGDTSEDQRYTDRNTADLYISVSGKNKPADTKRGVQARQHEKYKLSSADEFYRSDEIHARSGYKKHARPSRPRYHRKPHERRSTASDLDSKRSADSLLLVRLSPRHSSASASQRFAYEQRPVSRTQSLTHVGGYFSPDGATSRSSSTEPPQSVKSDAPQGYLRVRTSEHRPHRRRNATMPSMFYSPTSSTSTNRSNGGYYDGPTPGGQRSVIHTRGGSWGPTSPRGNPYNSVSAMEMHPDALIRKQQRSYALKRSVQTEEAQPQEVGVDLHLDNANKTGNNYNVTLTLNKETMQGVGGRTTSTMNSQEYIEDVYNANYQAPQPPQLTYQAPQPPPPSYQAMQPPMNVNHAPDDTMLLSPGSRTRTNITLLDGPASPTNVSASNPSTMEHLQFRQFVGESPRVTTGSRSLHRHENYVVRSDLGANGHFSPQPQPHHRGPANPKFAMSIDQTMTMDYRHMKGEEPPRKQQHKRVTRHRMRDDLQNYLSPSEDREPVGRDSYFNFRGMNRIDVTHPPKMMEVVVSSESSEGEDIEESTNVFDRRYLQARENPLYSSDPDLAKKDKQPKFTQIFKHPYEEEEYNTEIRVTRGAEPSPRTKKTTSSYQYNGYDQTDRQHVSKSASSSKTSEFEIHKLLQGAPPDSIRQTINVEREEEEIIGPLPEGEDDALLNFDTISEKVDIGMREGTAQVAVKVRCERIVPIRGVDDMFKKSCVIVTRLIEIDLMATDERRRLYDYITSRSEAITHESDDAHGSKGWKSSYQQQQLSTKDTFKLYKTFMGMAEADEHSKKRENIRIDRRVEEQHMPEMRARTELPTLETEYDEYEFDTDDLDRRLEEQLIAHSMRTAEPDTISFMSAASENHHILY